MIKDILVHLDGSSNDELRLQHAEAIASASQAHLTGLFTNFQANDASAAPFDGSAIAAGVIAELNEQARREGDVSEQRLTEHLARLSVRNEIRRIDGTLGQLARLTASAARCADLFVASRPYDGNDGERWGNLFEAVLFESGRGIYVVPPGRKPSDGIRQVLIAWCNTRETARAIAEATPFIENATRTTVLLVDPERDSVGGQPEPEIEVARHLDRHGTRVEVSLLESGGRPVSEIIRDEARRLSTDLVVMGAYGHSRAREWVLGGATIDMLTCSEIPILKAH
jgi:nucleotide-binding universal stress UspA family protein